jgi:5,10-methylenetetrahydromethanopterin reductase
VNRYGISLGVSPREPLRHVGEVAREIEEKGFEALWLIDFQLGMKDVYAAMALVALSTQRLLVGPGVTNLLTRHPTVTANAITAIDELSDGRAMIGLGTGWSAVLAAGHRPSRVGEVRAGIEALRSLFSGEETSLDGTPIRLATARRQIPIYLAAAQPAMLRLCGEAADGVILMGGADPEFCHWQLDYLYEGLERSGRPRSALTVDLQVTMSEDEDREKALADVRAWAVSQAATFVDWKRLPPSYERFRPEFARAAESYHLVEHLSLHAGHKQVVSDDFVSRVAIAGDERTCIQRLRELAGLDIDRITFALLSGGRSRRLSRLAETIIPAVGGAASG